MFRTALLIAAFATAVVAPISATPAAAVTVTLNLTGIVADTTTNNFTFGGYQFQSGTLLLTGFTPFTLDAGDVIDATVTLDGAFVVPASIATPSYAQFLGFNLEGPTSPVFASTTGSLLLSGLVGDLPNPTPAGCGNCTSFLGGRAFGDAFSFTGLTGGGSIDTLDAPRLIDSISISYQVNPGVAPAVPEPATWALLLGGFGLTGVAARRRRALPVRAA